ncbi:MAG: chemotaxis protein CheW [Aggregatilineales bacterium]
MDKYETKEVRAIGHIDLMEELESLNLPSGENTLQQLLVDRANQYAKRKETGDSLHEESLEALVFRLGGERYAIDVMNVLNVRRNGRITRVPGVPAFYRGVVNWRGQIVTVLDLRYFFNTEVDKSTLTNIELILVTGGGLELALVAEHIEDMSYILHSEIEPIDMIYAQGVTKERVMVLDLEQLFLDEQLMVAGVNN